MKYCATARRKLFISLRRFSCFFFTATLLFLIFSPNAHAASHETPPHYVEQILVGTGPNHNQATDPFDIYNFYSGFVANTLDNVHVIPFSDVVVEDLDPAQQQILKTHYNDSYLEDCKTQNAFFSLKYHSDHFGNEAVTIVDDFSFTLPGFQEIYPLQPKWIFKINSPDDVTRAQIQNLGGCPILVRSHNDETLDLWSGFKDQSQLKLGSRYVIVDKPTNKITATAGHFKLQNVYYYLDEEKPGIHEYPQYLLGTLTTIGASDFPALRGAVWGEIMIMPDSIRSPHWHMTEAESGFCYEGYGKVGAIVDGDTIPSSDGSGYVHENLVEEMFIHPKEIFMFPTGAQHYLRNIGKVPFKCILFLRHGVPTNPALLSTITLQNILGQTPLGVSAPFTNPNSPSLPLDGFTNNPELKQAYESASDISNYPNERFKPSHDPDLFNTPIYTAPLDCSDESWMAKEDAICPK